MALQVWLPLNGSLENLGLSDTTVSNAGATVNTAGKIGSCYSFGTAASRMELSVDKIKTFHEISVSLWLRITSFTTSWDTYFQLGLGGTPWTNYTIGLLRNNASYLCFCISDGSTATQANCKTGNLNLNQWYHITCTYKTGHICIYVDGTLTQDFATTIVPNFSDITYATIGSVHNGNYQTNCLMNDFRIYDHCLSQKEVKELSKGLIGHWPLNDAVGGENLFLNSDYSNGTNNWYGVNSSKISITTKDGYKVATGTKGTTNNIIGQTSQYSYTTGNTVDITISCDVYVEETGTFSVGNWISSSSVSGWQGWSCSRTNTPTTLNIGWNHVISIAKNGSCQYSGNLVTAFGFTGTTFWIKNIKLEKGSVATPWTPNPADDLYSELGLDSGIVYDTSGYGRNGIAGEMLSIEAGSPRYSVNYQFLGTNISMPSIHMTNMFTISTWIKTGARNDWGRYFQFWVSNNDNIGLNDSASDHSIGFHIVRTIDGTKTSLSDKYLRDYEFDTWYHIAATLNDKTLSFYRNGVIEYTVTIANDFTDIDMPFYINSINTGSGSRGTNHSLSDIRIYATALSADDIKELYETSASVDDHGNMWGYEIEEM